MSFYGVDFIFDGQFSPAYGLKILSTDDSIEEESSGGSDVEIFYDIAYRNPTRFQYGVSQNKVLTFQLSVMSESPITAINRSKIEKWLFGRMSPCKLQIIQPDLQSVYFNCYLLEPNVIYIGNVAYGFTFTVECDAPWAWQLPKTYMKADFSEVWRFYNDSDNTDYTHPYVRLKMKDSLIGDGSISIINQTDNNRTTSFSGLHAGEELTIDCSSQIIISSERRLISEFFNKKFFRLVPGVNNIQVDGELEYLKITYSNARKVGG